MINHTMSSDGNMINSKGSKGIHGGIPQYPQNNLGSANVSSTMAQGGGQLGNTAGYSTYEMPKGPRPFDPKKGIEYDMEMERYKIMQMENRFRNDLDVIRQDHQKFLEQSETRHNQKRKGLDEDKIVIQKEKNEALEEAKKKLTQLNKIDLENREL